MLFCLRTVHSKLVDLVEKVVKAFVDVARVYHLLLHQVPKQFGRSVKSLITTVKGELQNLLDNFVEKQGITHLCISNALFEFILVECLEVLLSSLANLVLKEALHLYTSGEGFLDFLCWDGGEIEPAMLLTSIVIIGIFPIKISLIVIIFVFVSSSAPGTFATPTTFLCLPIFLQHRISGVLNLVALLALYCRHLVVHTSFSSRYMIPLVEIEKMKRLRRKRYTYESR
mmetsp:Transcript_11139/g.18168  ORF Transcript_11139/g.18168 Transcript_11139/m.18168 type:complete len:228 (-) Transcript_11139:47-730(-)